MFEAFVREFLHMHRSRVPVGLLTGILVFLPFCKTGAAAEDMTAKVLPVSAELCTEMKKNNVIRESSPIGCNRLSLVKFHYINFRGEEKTDGEIVVIDAAANHVAKIFDELRRLRFPIQRARSVHEYHGDDFASMADNNTSAFNDRPIANATTPSLHAFGAAIDLNPVQNPCLRCDGPPIQPPAGQSFIKRVPEGSEEGVRTGLAEGVTDIFAHNGFVRWGGDWTKPTDYQHFEIPRSFVHRLIQLRPALAKAEFERRLERYIQCRKEQKGSRQAARKQCMAKVYA
jgi:hypothetical protein